MEIALCLRVRAQTLRNMLPSILVILCVSSGILVLNNGIAETTLTERFSWNPNRTVVVDRTVAVADHHNHHHHHQHHHHSSGYGILGVDRTTFSVDRPLWLQQFDIVKVFANDPTNERHVHRIPVKIKIRKIPEGDLKEADVIETVFTGQALLNSTHETTVNVFSKVLLKPAFLYEIRLKMPERSHLMYKDFLDIREHKITRFFSKSILVNFYQHNPTVVRPSTSNRDTDVRRPVSHGMVKRLHLKYSWF